MFTLPTLTRPLKDKVVVELVAIVDAIAVPVVVFVGVVATRFCAVAVAVAAFITDSPLRCVFSKPAACALACDGLGGTGGPAFFNGIAGTVVDFIVVGEVDVAIAGFA